ncbi:unnamed protein product [Caenorhabditis bovis]|uniref:Protein NDNF n=1 Tax=Caenorhabditis bovis TaxID=2654633 RepID=A0A8S1ER73_9PELO|nr:unnamed protein product [Caenorhabditis bovis]
MLQHWLLIFAFINHQIYCFNIIPLAYSTLHENTESIHELDGDVEKRFYLEISDETSPFFLFITPCGSPIHWQLFEIDKDITHGEEFRVVSDLSVSLDRAEKFKLIAGEEDTKRMTFFSHHLENKKIMLVIYSHGISSCRIFFSPSLLRVEDQYPALPHDTRLATTVETFKGDASAVITWKIAAHVKNAEPGRYRICTIVSRREPKWPLCDHIDDGVENIRCVPQTNNSILIPSLRRDKLYYVTVFVRDYKRGTTSAYETQTIRTESPFLRRQTRTGITRRQKKTTPRVLTNSKIRTAHLEAKKGAFVNYRFSVVPTDSAKQSAMLIVHACNGLVRLNIFRNGKILKRSEPFSGFRRFVVTNIPQGHLRFQLVNDDDNAKSIRIWAGTNLTTSPYPTLPDETSVKIVGRTCTTASIQWLRALESNVKYCVYKRKENSNFLENLVSLVGNLCEGGLSSSTFVGCYTQSPSFSASLIETTIPNLEPASTYRFDLLATPTDRAHPQALPYRTVWVQTNKSC